MALYRSSISLRKFSIVAIGLIVILGVSTAKDCKISRTPCDGQYSEIYRDETKSKTTYRCCIDGSDGADKSNKTATGCEATACVPVSQSGQDLCANTVGTRTLAETGQKVRFVEAIRDDCTLPRGGSGLEALCCGENTLELTLTSLIGVEPHEFPHFARLENDKGDSSSYCGGTIYNERYIITASHCVVDHDSHEPYDEENLTIFLDISIKGKHTDNEYKIEEIIIHPNSSKLITSGNPPTVYDIAILKLDRDIKFSDRVQALPLAPRDFDPIEYSDTAVILGFGRTDTLTASKKLQKADVYIRSSKRNILDKGGRYRKHKEYVDQLLVVGGFQDGLRSPAAAKGDSGGPAVCRDKSGRAVLCGITSFGPNEKENEQCEKKKTEEVCFPTVYAKVSYFRDWIEKHAGDQSKARVMKQPLYGKTVADEKYPHQVEIKSGDKNGHDCGGTLIAQDVAVTAAHCVANDKGNMKQGLMVTRKENGKEAETASVKNIEVLKGFRKGDSEKYDRAKRIAVFATQPSSDDPFYKNDLALVKLAKAMNVQKIQLPKIAEVEADPGPATEVAWMTDKRRKGQLGERDFHLMTHAECQTRMDRLSYVGYHVKVDGNVVCGVEEYSGGSKCDRTLGGGVFCGGNTLCGVQAFRLCEFTVPNAFVDVGLNRDWILETMKKM